VTYGLDHQTTEFDLESVKMNESVKCIGQRSRFLNLSYRKTHTVDRRHYLNHKVVGSNDKTCAHCRCL